MIDAAATPATTRIQGMLCPVCRVDLILADKQGVEIDYCPQCRGIWLDRGELDKLIEKNAAYEASAKPTGQPPESAPAPGYSQPAPWGGYNEGPHGGGHREGHDRGGHGGYRPGGFLGGLFRH